MAGDLVVKDVTAATWKDLERLFEARGGPKHCWCMVWRATPEEARHTDGASRKLFLKARVDSGVPVGILAYRDDEPIAWCSTAPKETYRKLDASKSAGGEEGVWSIVCFYIRREFRGSQLTSFLVESAVAYASNNGAAIVEAYPVDCDSPSYRFMGFVSTFEKCGFEEVGRAGTRRHVMRLRLNHS